MENAPDDPLCHSHSLCSGVVNTDNSDEEGVMGDVVDLPVITLLDIPVKKVLRKALDVDLEDVVVMGFTKEGGEYFASSVSDGGKVLWHCERVKHKLMQIADEAGDDQ
jgi:hypothetical protein